MHNDVISILCHTACAAFIYRKQHIEPTDLPEEVTQKFYIGKEIGSGAYGRVYDVYDLRSCQRLALKHVKSNLMTDSNLTKSLNEANVMKTLAHPCIVYLHEVYHNNNAVMLLLEFMEGGNLLERINTQRPPFLPERIAKFFFFQICYGVQYLHDKNIIHRDLKPDNILLASQETYTLAKISDFGLCKLVHSDTELRTNCGTQLYTAPEILSYEQNVYTNKVDIWSLGVLLFVCLCGSLPFHNDSKKPAVDQIKKGSYKFKEIAWTKVSKKAKDIIRQLLVVEANRRPPVEELFHEQWLLDDLVKEMAQEKMDPTKMCTQ